MRARSEALETGRSSLASRAYARYPPNIHPPPLFTLYEWLRVSHLCASQDASPDDARLSFLIMDVDEDGSITMKEFLQGCVHAISYNFEHIRLELKEGEMMRSGKELCGKGARTFVKRIMRRKLFK